MKSLEMNYIEVPPVFSAYNRFSKMYNENHSFLYRFTGNGSKTTKYHFGLQKGFKIQK